MNNKKIHWNHVFYRSNKIMGDVANSLGLDFDDVNTAAGNYDFGEYHTEEEWNTVFDEFKTYLINKLSKK